MIERPIKVMDIINYLNDKKYIFSFDGEENTEIIGFSSLFNYKEGTMTFISSLNKFRDYENLFKDVSINLIILDPSEKNFDCFSNIIRIENPKSIFFQIVEEFSSGNSNDEIQYINSESKLNNEFSYISPKAILGKNVRIGKGCIIEGNVYIGDNTEISHNVVIKNNTKIGKNCVILSGTIIGERGFNPLPTGEGVRKLLKHYGGVTIEDYVEIGDNCCISKGTIDDTIIKSGVKINKSATIAHNVVIEENTVITSPIFIAGSVVIGENCHIAASVIRNQCKIGDNATLGLGAVVVKDVEAGVTVVGNPAKPLVK